VEGGKMGLNMTTRKAVTKEIAPRYQRSPKKEKGRMLDEFVGLTGYCRAYASWLLRNCGRKVVRRGRGGKRVIFVAEIRKITRKRQKIYDEEVLKVLKRIWYIMDFPCGKRLAPCLQWMVPKLEHHGELEVSDHVREKLVRISASTIDKLLRSERRAMQLKPRAKTKPGTLLKHQIPIRTFSQWDERRAGFVEIDLVSHDGGNTRGDFIQTLNVTDVATAWTEMEAVKNKAHVWVFEALERIRDRVPFELLGIDSDNDSTFINAHLLSYCQQHAITFTRSRAYKKNDNCFVEQKNWTVVRKAVGYMRYDTEEELQTINELYQSLRLYINLFQPVMKVTEKTRVGSKIRKKYDEPKTPYQRVIASPSVLKETKRKLTQQYDTLNPVPLKRNIVRLQNRLFNLQTKKRTRHAEEHCQTSRIDSYMTQ
jgi:hypothetical protein